jgi:hypothetical protein
VIQIEQCFIFFQEYFGEEVLSINQLITVESSPVLYSKYEKEFKNIHNNLNDHYFVKLEGNYQLWQEVSLS